jgi:hypothetical protein
MNEHGNAGFHIRCACMIILVFNIADWFWSLKANFGAGLGINLPHTPGLGVMSCFHAKQTFWMLTPRSPTLWPDEVQFLLR